MDNVEEVVCKILSVDIKAVTNHGNKRTLSLCDFLNNDETAWISIDRDENNIPKCQINICFNCDGYTWHVE